MYDKRPAHKLATLRVLKGHRLSKRDRAELRYHARYIITHERGEKAKLARYHKRRKRSECYSITEKLSPYVQRSSIHIDGG